jgi:hypothetical protein
VSHKFRIGQTVDLVHRPLRAAAAGEYEIRHLMPPASDGGLEDPSYRIKSVEEKHERVVSESELTLSASPHSLFSPADHALASLAVAAPQNAPSPAQILIGRGRINRRLAASRAPQPGRPRTH